MNNMAGQFKFHYLTLSLSLSGEASAEYHTAKRWTDMTQQLNNNRCLYMIHVYRIRKMIQSKVALLLLYCLPIFAPQLTLKEPNHRNEITSQFKLTPDLMLS